MSQDHDQAWLTELGLRRLRARWARFRGGAVTSPGVITMPGLRHRQGTEVHMPKGGNPGPNGHRYRTARAAVLARSTICHLCGHDGADQADHVGPRSLNPHLDDADVTNLAPAHGVKGCPTCGEKCNQVKGNGTLTRPISSRAW